MYVAGIIKPHALSHARAIIAALTTQSIVVTKAKPICYYRNLIETLYDHMTVYARRDIAQSLVGKPGIALLLQAESIDCVLTAVGRESNPGACAPGSIRSLFGRHAPPTHVGQDLWWENAFHRPVDEREAVRDLHLLFKL